MAVVARILLAYPPGIESNTARTKVISPALAYMLTVEEGGRYEGVGEKPELEGERMNGLADGERGGFQGGGEDVGVGKEGEGGEEGERTRTEWCWKPWREREWWWRPWRETEWRERELRKRERERLNRERDRKGTWWREE